VKLTANRTGEPRLLAGAFVLYGLVATAVLAVNMPPFQNADEPNHFLRAAQVADGGVVGTRFSAAGADGLSRLTAGGWVDPAIVAASAPFGAVPFHSDKRVTQATGEARIYWSGERVILSFPNTVNYPPLLYVPSVIGILAGRSANITVVHTLQLSRVLTGIAAVAVGAAAIMCAGGAAVWIFMVLTLPMSLSLFASSSQDGLLLALGALAGALLVRALRRPRDSNWKLLAGLASILALMAAARPPYCALAMLLLGLPNVRLRWRMLGATAVVGCLAVWSGIVVATVLTNVGEAVGADPAAQIAILRKDPLLLVRVMIETMVLEARTYLVEFVGELGWLDVSLPQAYHIAARVMLGVAALAAVLRVREERIDVGNFSIIALGLIFAVIGLFAIQYVTWTVPGKSTAEGIQGRYFLPLALVATALLPRWGSPRLTWLHDILVALVVTFPVVTLAVVMNAVVHRYYLG
jgi:uncharacterized membrane protein